MTDGLLTIILKNITWYGYLAAFMYFSLQRQKEVDREPSVFDFAKYSKCTGKIHPFWFRFNYKGKPVDQRMVETLIEPAPFLIAGIVLALMSQAIGFVLIICSVCYSLSYFGAYYIGDNYIMDLIDKYIINEQLSDTFVDNRNPEKTKGFQIAAKKPADKELRKKLIKFMKDDPEEDAVAH